MVILKIFAIYIVAGVALGIYTMKKLNKESSNKKENIVRRNRTIIDSK